MQQIIQNGSRAVSIYANKPEGPFTARLYVNSEVGSLGDATLTTANRSSLAAITKWAELALAQ